MLTGTVRAAENSCKQPAAALQLNHAHGVSPDGRANASSRHRRAPGLSAAAAAGAAAAVPRAAGGATLQATRPFSSLSVLLPRWSQLPGCRRRPPAVAVSWGIGSAARQESWGEVLSCLLCRGPVPRSSSKSCTIVTASRCVARQTCGRPESGGITSITKTVNTTEATACTHRRPGPVAGTARRARAASSAYTSRAALRTPSCMRACCHCSTGARCAGKPRTCHDCCSSVESWLMQQLHRCIHNGDVL